MIPRPLLRLARFTLAAPFVPSLEVTRLDIRIFGLPAALEGLRIAQLSDLHVGPEPWDPLHLSEAVQAVRDFQPDLLLNTGDFLQGDPPIDRVTEAVRPFLLASSRLNEGPRDVAIFGNHDHYAGPAATEILHRKLEELGICVLVNDLACVAMDRAPMTIAGLSGQVEGIEDALSRLQEAPRPRIVLVHEPDLAQRLPAGIGDLVLAGHTHGGQITLPLLTGYIVRRFCGSRYIERFYRINDNPMYINRGLGCTGLPIRFRAAPEVTLITLAR